MLAQTTTPKIPAQLSPVLEHSAHRPEEEQKFSLGGNLATPSLYSKNVQIREEDGKRNVVFATALFLGKIAIKTVPKTPGMTRANLIELEKKLSREAKMVHSLGSCDNVISIYAAGETPWGYAIIMPVYVHM